MAVVNEREFCQCPIRQAMDQWHTCHFLAEFYYGCHIRIKKLIRIQGLPLNDKDNADRGLGIYFFVY